jgi:hypothetical protein
MRALDSPDVVLDVSLPMLWRQTVEGPRVVGCQDIDAEVVVFQRPCKREIADAIPHLQARGVAVVVEVDDDHQALSADNPCFADFHPRRNPERNWEHLRRACATADLVTVTTPALADRYGRHGRVAVLPNYVPARYLEITRPAQAPTPLLGWTGTPTTHRGDLEVVGMAVTRALDATDARFLAIGSDATAPLLGIAAGRGDSAAWRPLTDGYPELVATLDVGIAPLADTRFNAAKSWLKPLEYAALGVACVMSPREEYRRLHGLGVGELAERPRQWEGTLRRLLTDHAWRQQRVEAGRAACRRLTYEVHAERWWEAWRAALEQRAARCA